MKKKAPVDTESPPSNTLLGFYAEAVLNFVPVGEGASAQTFDYSEKRLNQSSDHTNDSR